MPKEKNTDSFGDKVKAFEKAQAKVSLNENEPICVRIDGKAFHTYTKGLPRPYDERLSMAMIQTMNYLVELSDARLGYTQSDEISLVYFKTHPYQQTFFAGRVQKLCSILASMATAKFNEQANLHIAERKGVLALFDCRVWNVPSLQDAADVFIWRQEDAIKNAITMAAGAYYSHSDLQGRKSAQKLEMLKEKGVSWDEFPQFFKSGTFCKRSSQLVAMSDELRDLPGNKGVDYYVRTEVANVHLPRLRQQDNVQDILFGHVFNNHELQVAQRNSKKKGTALNP